MRETAHADVEGERFDSRVQLNPIVSSVWARVPETVPEHGADTFRSEAAGVGPGLGALAAARTEYGEWYASSCVRAVPIASFAALRDWLKARSGHSRSGDMMSVLLTHLLRSPTQDDLPSLHNALALVHQHIRCRLHRTDSVCQRKHMPRTRSRPHRQGSLMVPITYRAVTNAGHGFRASSLVTESGAAVQIHHAPGAPCLPLTRCNANRNYSHDADPLKGMGEHLHSPCNRFVTY